MRRVRRRKCCMMLGCRNRNPLFFFSLLVPAMVVLADAGDQEPEF